LLDIPLDGSVGAVSLDPAYLICTHGRHDTCCALRGRPIAAALAAVRPAGTWECSHLGGDRFAPNLLVLPYGFYYGHVDAAAAIGIVSATERGRVEPTWLRGRSSLPAAVQVAQQHARLALHESAASAFAPLRVEPIAEPTGWRVVLDSDEGPVVVVLRAQLSNPPALLTCSSGHPERVTELHLVSLTGPGAGNSTDVDR
jgi:Sucrase/ferredoxin-like